MSRRPVNPARRPADGGIPFASALHQKSRASPLLSIGLVLVGGFLLIAYSYSGSGGLGGDREALSKVEDTAALSWLDQHDRLWKPRAKKNRSSPGFWSNKGDLSSTSEVQRALPFLKKAYGEAMRKVLHVGPDTCSVVYKLIKEEDSEAWGVEPYDMEDADATCKSLVRKGIVRVADLKFPLPYSAKSFSLVIVSDALDYLSPKYLNKTLPELARVSMDGLVIFTGYPGQQRAKVAELSKFGRPAKLRSSSWWIRYFLQTGLEENEAATKKFEQVAIRRSYKPSCQVFHLNAYH